MLFAAQAKATNTYEYASLLTPFSRTSLAKDVLVLVTCGSLQFLLLFSQTGFSVHIIAKGFHDLVTLDEMLLLLPVGFLARVE
jgi:hypothetical protein